MRVVTLEDIPENDLREAVPIKGWTGGEVRRSRQNIIEPGDPKTITAVS